MATVSSIWDLLIRAYEQRRRRDEQFREIIANAFPPIFYSRPKMTKQEKLIEYEKEEENKLLKKRKLNAV